MKKAEHDGQRIAQGWKVKNQSPFVLGYSVLQVDNSPGSLSSRTGVALEGTGDVTPTAKKQKGREGIQEMGSQRPATTTQHKEMFQETAKNIVVIRNALIVIVHFNSHQVQLNCSQKGQMEKQTSQLT